MKIQKMFLNEIDDKLIWMIQDSQRLTSAKESLCVLFND